MGPEAAWARMTQVRRMLSDTIVLVGAGVIVNVLNYTYVLIALGLLSKAEFGGFSTLVNCLTISTVITNVMQLEVTRRVAYEPHTRVLLSAIVRRTLLAGVGLGVVVLVAAPSLARLFHLESVDIWALYFSLVALALSCIANGWFGGKQLLKAQGLWAVLGTLLKVASGGLLLWWGAGSAGGIVAFGLGLLLVFGAAWFCWSGVSQSERSLDAAGAVTSSTTSPVHTFEAGIGHLALLICAYVLLILPFSVDQLLVQTLFVAVSGDYGAVAMLGKLVFFASAPVYTVMYSHLCSAHGNRAVQSKIFGLAVAASLFLGISVMGALGIFGDLLVTRVLPDQYRESAGMAPIFSIGLLVYGIAYASSILCIARHELGKLTFTLAPAVIVQLWLFLNADGTLSSLVWRQNVTYGVQFGCIMVMAVWRFRGASGHEE